MKVKFIASLPDTGAFLTSYKHGNSIVKFDVSASENHKLIPLNTLAACYRGDVTFEVTIEYKSPGQSADDESEAEAESPQVIELEAIPAKEPVAKRQKKSKK